MAENGEDFYDLSSPVFPQQGDIFPNVPLISTPPSRDLIILRGAGGVPWEPRAGPLEAFPEQSLTAFDDAPEYIAASAERGLAALLTQTCDLMDQDYWLVCPLLEIEGTTIDKGNLFAGKYPNLFGLPPHPLGYFADGYLELIRCFTIRRETVEEKDRIASLALSMQHALTDKIAEALARTWGFSPEEIVPQTGKYKCVRCFQFYDVEPVIVEFEAGKPFGQCKACAKIKKHAQWKLLRKHRKY